jgi:hypothetical protein
MQLARYETTGQAAPMPLRPWRAAHFYCACAVLIVSGCQSSQPGAESPPAQTAAAPVVPPEYTAGAQNYLGPSAGVLAFGDLALNGGNQILVIDPMPGTEPNSSPEIRIVRAVILDKQGDTWKEIFRCDERLTNEKGFLLGTPTSPASGWEMKFTQDPTDGLELTFAEADGAPDANHSATYVVRWNQKVKRYECLDKKGDRFLGELPAVGEPVPRDLLR